MGPLGERCSSQQIATAVGVIVACRPFDRRWHAAGPRRGLRYQRCRQFRRRRPVQRTTSRSTASTSKIRQLIKLAATASPMRPAVLLRRSALPCRPLAALPSTTRRSPEASSTPAQSRPRLPARATELLLPTTNRYHRDHQYRVYFGAKKRRHYRRRQRHWRCRATGLILTFGGCITNAGKISATGNGIVVGGSGSGNGRSITVSNFSGGITNAGTIALGRENVGILVGGSMTGNGSAITVSTFAGGVTTGVRLRGAATPEASLPR